MAEEREIFGYTFKNAALLDEALTTPAYRMCERGARDNQRLEFLGDAVLGLMAADALFRTSPECSEGELTVRRTHMVSTAALCAAAARLKLADRLRRNKGAEALPDDSHTLADAVEAILGAAWLDGGLDAARRIFETLELAVHAETGAWHENPKGELQRLVQAMRPRRQPVYTTLSMKGECHNPLFTVKVAVPGVGEATGEAHSRKDAEVRAAAALLAKLSPPPDEA